MASAHPSIDIASATEYDRPGCSSASRHTIAVAATCGVTFEMTQGAPPRVTICVPVLNAAQWVAESLTSIARQSFADFEVLISDDASTAGSAEICRQFTSDPR